MEFNEKLQMLRKQNNLTQEQLANKLFVSRTAISKWESGKGYPNINSLKAISNLFSVSIDELLSSEEIIILAEGENRQTIQKIFSLIYGILDIIVGTFIFLPLFVQKEGVHFRSVSLIQWNENVLWIHVFSYCFLILITLIGIVIFTAQFKESEELWQRLNVLSLFCNALAVLFFISVRQLYVTTLMFLFIMVKVSLLLKRLKENQK